MATWFATIDPRQRAALRRINRLAMQHAAEALTLLLKQPVRLEASGGLLAKQAPCNSDRTKSGLGVYLHIAGELNGGMLLFLPQADACWLCGRLLGQMKLKYLLAEPASSTLKEVGNIIASAFLASLDQQLHLRALPGPPQLFPAPLAELLEQQCEAQSSPGPVICNRLRSTGGPADRLQAAIYLFPETESLDLLLERATSKTF